MRAALFIRLPQVVRTLHRGSRPTRLTALGEWTPDPQEHSTEVPDAATACPLPATSPLPALPTHLSSNTLCGSPHWNRAQLENGPVGGLCCRRRLRSGSSRQEGIGGARGQSPALPTQWERHCS